MPKATVSIGGYLSELGLGILADAMARDGLPIALDPDDTGEFEASVAPLNAAGAPSAIWYREQIIAADSLAEAISLGADSSDDDIDVAARESIAAAHQLGLIVRIHCPGTYDRDYGESSGATISVSGSAAPIKGHVIVDGDGAPLLRLTAAALASPDDFAALYDQAVQLKALADYTVPPIEFL